VSSTASAHPATVRRHPIGAEVLPAAGGVSFRIWAPASPSLAIVIDDTPNARTPSTDARTHPLERDPDGYFRGVIADARPGTRYWCRLHDGHTCSDPASRFQPDGPEGPSLVVDPSSFEWTDQAWPGLSRSGLVIYEMHVGTFTPEGTWRSAMRELPALVELGITAIEIMPIADFPGDFGWGYDGVNQFAPSRLYGAPDDFRQFVDAAHALGLGVVLDVVYNHFGPVGCYLDRFSPSYFQSRSNEWGRALNFDGDAAGPVREFFLTNAACWIEEFHLDGLRLDATQAISDSSGSHIMAEVVDVVRRTAGARTVWLVGENEPQRTGLVRSRRDGGIGLDALWNDDFHHTAMVAATGRREAYYTDYFGSPQEFISAAKHGFLYQGQLYSWQKNGRGTPGLDLPPEAFVTFLQNHDQVANSWKGHRLHAITSPGKWRTLTAILLLGPSTPMIFQGQEFAATSPFLYFADHDPEVAAKVRDGRREFMSQFPSVAHAEIDETLPDPSARETFERCKLDPSERERHREAMALHASLIQLRLSDGTFYGQGRWGFDGAVLAPQAFALRYFGSPGSGPEPGDRLILVNLGAQLNLTTLPEPLLAPPLGYHWVVMWSSEDPQYGGSGTPDIVTRTHWLLPGESAIVLHPAQGRA
jgi:maltooligosyltrehalose trehalohydrolase